MSSPSILSAHSSDIGDIVFNPFRSNQLASCGGNDGTVKLWTIPSSVTSTSSLPSSPDVTFNDLDAVHSLAFHPSADGILAAGTKNGLSIFDLASGSQKYKLNNGANGRDITSIHFNRNGSLISTVGKNASLSIIDPRSPSSIDLFSNGCAMGNTLIKKLQHSIFIGGEGTSLTEYLVLFGVSSAQRPTMTFIDPRSPGTALKSHDFDFSAGYTLPNYDRDTNTIIMTVRGSEMITLLDVESDRTNPSIWPSHTFHVNSPVKGLALLPKPSVRTNMAEINRVYTLGAEAVEGFTIAVTRKTVGFHSEVRKEKEKD